MKYCFCTAQDPERLIISSEIDGRIRLVYTKVTSDESGPARHHCTHRNLLIVFITATIDLYPSSETTTTIKPKDSVSERPHLMNMLFSG